MQQPEVENKSSFGIPPEPSTVFYLALFGALIAPFMNLVSGGKQSGYLASVFGASMVFGAWIVMRLIWAFIQTYIEKETKGCSVNE